MTDQPEALRLAQTLEQIAPSYLEDDEMEIAACLLREQHAEIERLKAENERLHKENERVQNTKHYEAPFGFVLNPDYLVPELKAENERLREALEKIVALGKGMPDETAEVEVAKAIRARVNP